MASSGDFAAYVVNDDDKELLLSRVKQLEPVDDATGFKCARCDRLLLKHYVADCGHKFCANCRRVLTVSKGNCPNCGKPIESIDLQDVEFNRRLYDLRACCPNKSYGCPFISQLKDLGGHLRGCKDTKDNALPVLIEKPNDVLEILGKLSNKIDKLNEDVTKIDSSLKLIEKKVDNNVVVIDQTKSECDAKIAKLENTTRENQLKIVSTINNLEQKIFVLESFEQLRNPQEVIYHALPELKNINGKMKQISAKIIVQDIIKSL